MAAEPIQLDPELVEAIERRLADGTSAEGRAPARERPFEASITELALGEPAGDGEPSHPEGEPAPGVDSLDQDDLLTVAIAAVVAGCSLRTIRRAYRAGALLAYRDGNGRGIRIRYGDLRNWMMATTVAAPARPQEAEKLPSPLERLDMRGKAAAGPPGENLALLNAARARRRRGGAPGGGAGRRAAGSATASRA